MRHAGDSISHLLTVIARVLTMRLLTVVWALCLSAFGVEALSWAISRQRVFGGSLTHEKVGPDSHDSLLPRSYEVALHELQELESEPLCHRNAARLLVNHCQLLEGKSKATILTDNGRAARDFVDSYSASLAICDLERGNFQIPPQCAQFREDALIRLPMPIKPDLHVVTKEIDSCLEGLAQSDSAWNTWVSYRHKALRFCEAARADNKKDENIRIYQRVTQILSTLTSDVEEHMKTRLEDLDHSIDRTNSKLEAADHGVYSLRIGLRDLESMVSTKLYEAAEDSGNVIARANSDAHALQEFLAIMMQKMAQSSESLKDNYETALESFNERANNEADVILTTLTGMMTASSHLRDELETSHTRVEEMERTQERVEKSMRSLELKANSITSRYDAHNEQLRQAQSSTNSILETLDSAATSASTFRSSLSSTFWFQGFWPYIYCPAASLVMGSYGLPPSTVRNIALIGAGEIAGFLVSNISALASSLNAKLSQGQVSGVVEGNTTSNDDTFWAETDIFNQDVRKRRHIRAF